MPDNKDAKIERARRTLANMEKRSLQNDGSKKRVPGVDKQQGPTPPAPKR